MRTLSRLGTLPVTITVLTGITAVYYLLVVWGNLEAYSVNHGLVESVFAMDTLFQDEYQQWRAIGNGAVVHAAYVLIIIWEFLIAAVLTLAFVAWLRSLFGASSAQPGGFAMPRRLSTLGWTMVILLFAGGFITIGGEWFLMWQSESSGALQTAVNNSMIAAVGILLANLPSRQLEPATPAGAGDKARASSRARAKAT